MSTDDSYYRRNLPHYHPVGYALFITFRLTDSLPSHVLVDLKMQREHELKLRRSSETSKRVEIENGFFTRFDHYLDRCQSGPHWLEIDSIAQVVFDEIIGMDKNRYKLIACCIMPNHVHLLIEPFMMGQVSHSGKSAKYPVTDTLRLRKGTTARKANLELNRSSSFWQHESYDHYIRDEEELRRTIQYILNNPVEAGLINDWKAWKFAYLNTEYGNW